MTGFSALAQEPATSAESSSPAATATASSELTVSGETHWGQIEVVGPGLAGASETSRGLSGCMGYPEMKEPKQGAAPHG